MPGTHVLVAGTEYGSVSLVDADHVRAIRRLRAGPREYRLGGKRLSDPIWTPPGFSANGRLLATASSSGTVRLWSLPDGRPMHTLRFPYGVSDAQLSPSGRWLTVQALNRDIVQDRLEIWDIRGHRRVTTTRPPSGVSFGRFSPDGRLLAVGDLLGRVTVFSTATWRPVTPPRAAGGGEQAQTAASFTPDRQTLATGTNAGTVQLWDVSRRLAPAAWPVRCRRDADLHARWDAHHRRL